MLAIVDSVGCLQASITIGMLFLILLLHWTILYVGCLYYIHAIDIYNLLYLAQWVPTWTNH